MVHYESPPIGLINEAIDKTTTATCPSSSMTSRRVVSSFAHCVMALPRILAATWAEPCPRPAGPPPTAISAWNPADTMASLRCMSYELRIGYRVFFGCYELWDFREVAPMAHTRGNWTPLTDRSPTKRAL